MCGIAGIIVHQTSLPDKAKALQLLAHRGPDGEGFFSDEKILLLHTRLAIQDLSAAAAQPMYSEDGRYTIVFNGEIYNHNELRRQLPSKNYRTHSDTETLLQAYHHLGAGMLPLLNGIFSFAIYDRHLGRLFLARDAFGVKPLYYYHHGENFSFASEMKCLLALSPVDKSLNIDSLFQALVLQWPVSTGFTHITTLAPGHYIDVNLYAPQTISIVNWQVNTFTGVYENITEEEWVDRLDTVLTKAVQRQLLSDKPIAYFLSGGLDSSLLAAIARKLQPTLPIHAYTIDAGQAFGNEGFSQDLPYARSVAEHLNIVLHTIEAKADVLDRFDQMIWQLDAPQADIAPIWVQDIAHSAKRNGFDVLIGGVGGDDIFSGYRRHQALKWEGMITATPVVLRKAAQNILLRLPGTPRGRRLKKAALTLPEPSLQRLFHYFFWTNKALASSLFTADAAAQINTHSIEDFFSAQLAAIPAEGSLLNKALYLEQNSFLPLHNLNYTDKMSMAEGVEIRVPYLDKELTELAARIPPELKMKGSETKYLLKKVAERYLPKEVIYRSKTGFGAPLRTWMRHDAALQQETWKRLDALLTACPNLFRRETITELYRETICGRQDHAYTLLALLAIESWLRQFTSTE